MAVILSGCVWLNGCSVPSAKTWKEGLPFWPFSTAQEAAPVSEQAGEEAPYGVTEPTPPVLFAVESKEEYEDKLYEGESLFCNAATWYYYYEQLDPGEQDIYDALMAITRDPTSTDYRKGVHTTEDPESETFARQIARAYQAMIFDHPELFWFRRQSGQFEYYFMRHADAGADRVVMFQLAEPYEAYEEEMQAYNAAVDAFLEDIDRTLPQPLLALVLHDRLIDLLTYDDALADSYMEEWRPFDYGYTAYGAFLENGRGQAHTVVCDGYSYAYEYLLQQVGIRTTRIGGSAGAEGEALMPHSWNLIELDGEWYEIDATWDDIEPALDWNDSENELFLQAVSDPDYWGRLRHHLYGCTTEEMRTFVADDSYTYDSAMGQARFMDGVSLHRRDIREEAETADSADYLSYLAPIAYGTVYSYEGLQDLYPDFFATWNLEELPV